ncbi:Beta-barrel assembly-enhancing protease [subsurface metagenome]
MTTDSPSGLFKAAIKAGCTRDYPKAIQILKDLLCKTDQIPEALLYLGRSYHALGDFNSSVQILQFFLKADPNSAAGHFFIGRSYLSLGLYKQALKHLKKSTELDSGFAPCLGLLGLTLLKAGRPKAAIFYFEKALEIDPDQPKIYNGYLNAVLTQAIRLFRRGNLEDSKELFQFILKHRKETLIVHLHLASIYRESGDHALSLQHFKQASSLAPDDPILYLQQAVTYLKSGDHRLAFEEMDKAMKILGRDSFQITDPENLLRLMTLILFQNSRYREAIICGRRVLKYSFHDIEIHAILAECFRNLGDLNRAKNHYLRALDRDRKRLALNYGLVGVLWEKNEYDELLKILKRIKKLNPDDEFAPYYLALTLPHLEESLSKTITILQEQIRKNGPDPPLMCALAGEYLKADLPELAEGWYLKTLKLSDGQQESLQSLITVYKRLQKSKELSKAYSEYLKYFPEDLPLRREFIQILFEGEKYEQASAEILKILPQEPENRALKRMLAVSYRKEKKYPEAIILFRELLREEPESEELLRALVFCLAETNRKKAAIALLEKSLNLSTPKAAILLPLGVLYFREKEFEKSTETFRRLISLSPDDWKAHYNLGIVYGKTGNHEFSERFLKRARKLKQKNTR